MKQVMSLCCAMIVLLFGASQALAHGGGGNAMGDWDKADECGQQKGHYLVHFTTYQQKNTAEDIRKLQEVGSVRFKQEFQSYCGGVPKTGKLWMAFDLYNDEMRTLPVSVRIVEAEEAGHQHNAGEGDHDHTILSMPPAVYRDGTVRAYTEINKPGHYVAILKLEKVGPAIAHHPHPASDPGEMNRVIHSHGSNDPTPAEIAAVDPTYSFPFTVGLPMKTHLPWYMTNLGTQLAGTLLGISALVIGVRYYMNGKGKKQGYGTAQD